LPKAPSEPDGISGIHEVVIGRVGRVTMLPLPIPLIRGNTS
jgi:hypothetical protein